MLRAQFRRANLPTSFSSKTFCRTMKITPVTVRDDNYAYILQSTPANGQSQAVFVDVYDVPKVHTAARDLGLKDDQIVGLITTHGHYDHAGGNASFAKLFPGVPIYGGKGVSAVTNVVGHGDKFTLFPGSGAAVNVSTHATPCHTRDSICFYVEDERSESDLASTGSGTKEGAEGEKKRGVFTGCVHTNKRHTIHFWLWTLFRGQCQRDAHCAQQGAECSS